MKCVASRWSLVLIALLAAGCLNLGPTENPYRYYLLGAEAGGGTEGTRAEGTVAPSAGEAGRSLGLRPLRVASYLERLTIAVRQDPHEIRFAEFERWGEDLDRGVSRALAVYLAAQPAVASVDVVPWPRWATHDYTLGIQVLRFEGVVPGRAGAAEGQAHLLATWELIGPGEREVLARGTTEYLEDGWTVGDYGELAAMLDAGIQVLAAEIAARLDTLPAP